MGTGGDKRQRQVHQWKISLRPTPPLPPDKGGMALYTGVVQEGLQTPPTSLLYQYITYHRGDGGALPLGEPP